MGQYAISPRHYLLLKIIKEIMVIIIYAVILLWLQQALTHYRLVLPFYTPRKHQKIFDFLMLSGDIKSSTGLSAYELMKSQQKGTF